MDKYLNGGEITNDEIKKCIRKGTIGFKFVPVLCGSAFKNKGVQALLNAVCAYLPSPLDLPPIKGINLDNDKNVYYVAYCFVGSWVINCLRSKWQNVFCMIAKQLYFGII